MPGHNGKTVPNVVDNGDGTHTLAVAVVSGASGGGTGDASAAKQDQQTARC